VLAICTTIIADYCRLIRSPWSGIMCSLVFWQDYLSRPIELRALFAFWCSKVRVRVLAETWCKQWRPLAAASWRLVLLLSGAVVTVQLVLIQTASSRRLPAMHSQAWFVCASLPFHMRTPTTTPYVVAVW
jgi:hypothetical protein